MKKDLTEIIYILDRSGSMHNLTADTIGGYNSMIEKQKNEPGEAYVTTVLFDDGYELLHDHVNIKEIQPITNKEYYAKGCTALLDAVGKTINSIGSRLSATPEEERPEKVILVIVTDGLENSSCEFDKQTVKDMIEHQQNKYSWTFMFLGANMDAVSEAASYGISSGYSRTYMANSRGTDAVYTATCDALTSLRSMDSTTYCDAKVKAIETSACLDYIDVISSSVDATSMVDDRVAKLEDVIDGLSSHWESTIATSKGYIDNSITSHISTNASCFETIDDIDIANTFA